MAVKVGVLIKDARTEWVNISFLACTKIELWDLIVCTVVNGETFHAVILTLVRQCPIYSCGHKYRDTLTCNLYEMVLICFA